MNYSEVVAAVQAYSDRSDSATIANMDVFLRMVEARVNRALRNEEMCIQYDIPTVQDQASYDLPADYAGMRSISLETDGAITPLAYINPELTDWQVDNESYDDVVYYTIRSKKLVLSKVPGDALSNIRINYFKKVPELTSTDTTNWLSEMHPDAYVNGAMVEVSAFVKNVEAASAWDARFNVSVAEIIASNWGDKWSGTPMVMMVAE